MKRSRSWHYPATVLLLGVLSLAMLAWTDQLYQRLRIHQFSSDTLRDSRTRAATAHLWLEEGLTDGVDAKLQRARTDFAEALRLSQVVPGRREIRVRLHGAAPGSPGASPAS